MKPLFFILVTVLLIIAALVIFTGIFLGTGYFITLITPLTLFQAAIIFLMSAFVLAFIILTFVVSQFLGDFQKSLDIFDDYDDEEFWDEEDELDDFEDEDDEFDEDEDDDIGFSFHPRKPKILNLKKEKIGRNALCPCGSGKKYKNCCGKNK